MKTAIILSGNLRTFLMPTRENPNSRVCDDFIKNIVKPNNADVFAFTDTSDFFYNGTQYYATDRRIEILNNDAFRLYKKVDFIDNATSRNIIQTQLKMLGSHLKSLQIEDPFTASNDPKFSLLSDAKVGGSSPTLLIHQFRKLKLAYNALRDYENANNFKYDLVIKWRFDISSPNKLVVSTYNYNDVDAYVAGDRSPIIYDWHAFGKRQAMECLNLYDHLGKYLPEGKVHFCDKCRYYGRAMNTCNCNAYSEITLAPEYHLFRVFRENGVRLANSGYSATPYRYQDTSVNTPIDQVMNNLNIDATLINYVPTSEIGKQTYHKK